MPKRTAVDMLSNNSQMKRKKACYSQNSSWFLDVHSSHYIINGSASLHTIDQKAAGFMVPTTGTRPSLHKVDDDTYDLVDQMESGHLNQPVAVCSSNNHLLPYHRSLALPSSVKEKQSKRSLVRKSSIRSLYTNTTDSGCFSIADGNLSSFISVTGTQLSKFFELLEIPIIRKFMEYDICLRVTDKYLMAMAFAYFARAKLTPNEYNTMNMFVALYLAHDVEEDEEDYKYEIFPWALGKMWRSRYKALLNMRDSLWKRMDYRAIVSRKCCEEIMSIEPEHAVWQRERKEHHGGAIRPWLKDKHDDGRLIGPDGSPRHCKLCNYPPNKTADSDHDSLSPENDQLWLQMDSSSSSFEEFTPANITNSSLNNAGFNMNDLQNTLLCSSNKTNSSGKGRSLASGDTTLDWVDCFSDIESPYRCVEV